MAFYLKYRPQKVSELDLENVRKKLERLLSNKEIPHALLFTGPKGTGKTSSARIVAKSINCTKNKEDYEPCNQCLLCKAITFGRSLDLIEIDAASNRGIDDIRELKEQIKLSPHEADYKVYVIDEVHMLTKQAFNALLKTLEEPPKHAVFILCTTEPHQLPDTIISRCLRFDFHKAGPEEVKRSLKRVVKGEKLEVEKGVLDLIAKNSEGSFRDATKVLEQLGLSQKKINKKDVEEFLNKGTNIKAANFVDKMLVNKTKELLNMVSLAAESGIDFKWFIQQILLEFNSRMLVLWQKGEKEKLKKVIKATRLIDRAGRELRGALVPQLPFEIAIMEWDEEFDTSKTKQSGTESNKNKPDKKAETEEKKDKQEKKAEKQKKNPQDTKKPEIKAEICEFSVIQKKWPQVLQKVKPYNHSVSALLKAARPLELKNDKIFIEVFYNFHKEKLEEEKCLSLVEKALQKVFNLSLQARYVLGKKQKSGKKKTEKNNSSDVDQFIKTAEKIFS